MARVRSTRLCPSSRSSSYDGIGSRATICRLVRHTPYACASFAFAFDEELPLSPEQSLKLDYRVVIADGAWSAERAEAYAERWRASGAA